MAEATLFPLPAPREPRAMPPTRPDAARVLRPDRQQVAWVAQDLDALLPADHQARAIWALLERLDLSTFYAQIKATVDRPGRPTADPRVLLALWLLATVDGVGSARRLARLCEEHHAYQWVCGGVPINYHLLSDFRVAHHAALDEILTQIVGSLMAAGAVTLEGVAQDGMRVRASAGAASFRRRARLQECLAVARERVERLAKEREHPDPGVNRREVAARERAARERVARVEEALAYLPQAQAAKDRQQQTHSLERRVRVTEPRVSTTDPEARVMKMPDGGFRPAYNVEFATDQASGVIVGVDVTSEGTDAAQAAPMVEQVTERTGVCPQAYLMDGGFATREAVTTLTRRGLTVYAPVRRSQSFHPSALPLKGKLEGQAGRTEEDRYVPHEGDTPEVVSWRARMGTEEAKAVYRGRGATAEWSNAQARQHGVSQFTVRGIAKVITVMLLVAVTHNLLRWIALGA